MSAPPIELPELAEGVDVEVKKAAGRDGRGAVPSAFFSSYSAMANTYGGTVYLGVEQRGKAFYATGLPEVAAVRKALWDGLNNPQQVNRNILRDEHVTVQTLGGQSVLRVQVPRAARTQRPVTLCLAALVRQGLLESHGNTRNTTYRLPTGDAGSSKSEGHERGALPSESLANNAENLPIFEGTGAELNVLRDIARPVASKGRAAPETVRSTIIALCEGPKQAYSTRKDTHE